MKFTLLFLSLFTGLLSFRFYPEVKTVPLPAPFAPAPTVDDTSDSERSSLNLQWESLGPMNVGGRIRALLDDPARGKIFAAAAGGGLWYSTNDGGNWNKVNDQAENLIVSELTMAPNGDMYYSTGESYAYGLSFNSGGKGGGIFKSTDGINFSLLPSTKPSASSPDWYNISSLVTHRIHSNFIYVGTPNGMVVSMDWGTTWASDFIKTGGNPVVGKVHAIAAGNDGGVLVAINNKIFYSPTGNADSFTDITPVGYSTNKTDVIIAPSNPSVFYVSSVTNYGFLQGMWLTEDRGATWTKIGQHASSFNPFGPNGSGWYNNSLSVNPNNSGEVLLGGYEIWQWKKVNQNPISGSWTKITKAEPNSPSNPDFVYPYIHNMIYRNGEIMVCSDGGVFGKKPNEIWKAKNRDLNTVLLYSVGFSGTGEVIGAAQNAGVLYVDPHQGQDSRYLFGESGGYCEISQLNHDIVFATSDNGYLTRSDNRGINNQNFVSNALENTVWNFGASYVTPIVLWESFDNTFSQDSFYHVNLSGEQIGAGSQLALNSQTGNIPFTTTISSNLDHGDSILVQDKVQSRLALGLTNSVWICMNPINTSEEATWIKIANITGTVQPMMFSRDGNHLFVGTQSGNLYRISGLLNLNKTDSTTSSNNTPPSYIQSTLIGQFNRAINGIAVDPNDPNHVIAVFGLYNQSNYISRTTNALQATDHATASWANKQGWVSTGLPREPVYSVLIDKNNSNVVLLGTDKGIYATSDISATDPVWTEENTSFPRVPTYMIRQQLMENNWERDIWNEGCIYAATHGRGFWKTCTLGSPTVNVSEKSESPADMLRVYPNPAVNYTNTDIVLGKDQDITVRVYDLNGRLITSQQYGKLAAGHHKLTLNSQQIAAGTYLISVEGTAGFKKASKLSVLK